MKGKKLTLFQQIVNRKGWTFTDVCKRWGISERQMSRIADSGSQRDIDAANGLPILSEKIMNPLADYLNITDYQLEELDIELLENSGSSGDMVYSLYFYVPDNTPEEILNSTGWKVGQLISGIPVHILDEEDC